jgi:hypothetical protein
VPVVRKREPQTEQVTDEVLETFAIVSTVMPARTA